jgi:glycosyltransferase involved in cell wall biosynthesis
MHIGFLTTEYVTAKSLDGGLANYLKKTAKALVNRGHRVTIFWLSDRDSIWSDNDVTVVEIKKDEWCSRIWRIPLLRRLCPSYNQILNSRKIAQRVMQFHNENPLDILQQSSYLSTGNSLLHNNQIPIVCRASSYTPILREAYGLSTSFNDVIIDWLEFRQMKESDAAFSPSDFIANVFSAKSGRKIPTIRTPLDIPMTGTLDSSFYHQYLKGKKYLLFFGTLSRIKGTDLIAEVIPRILKEYPDIFFVFIGRDDGLPGGRKIRDLISERSKTYEDHIFIHPAIQKSQLYPVISNAIGVLIPSRVDNYPNVCLEAQYFGIPVIGTQNSSLEEMIEDKKTGFLAQNGDVNSLQASIAEMLEMTHTRYDEMKKNIQFQVQKDLDEDRTGRLIDFYGKVIADYQEKIASCHAINAVNI